MRNTDVELMTRIVRINDWFAVFAKKMRVHELDQIFAS